MHHKAKVSHLENLEKLNEKLPNVEQHVLLRNQYLQYSILPNFTNMCGYMCMHVFICAYMHVRICIYMYASIYVNICICVYICMCLYIYMCI